MPRSGGTALFGRRCGLMILAVEAFAGVACPEAMELKTSMETLAAVASTLVIFTARTRYLGRAGLADKLVQFGLIHDCPSSACHSVARIDGLKLRPPFIFSSTLNLTAAGFTEQRIASG